jgi:deoxycytidine triphosphate deaminase
MRRAAPFALGAFEVILSDRSLREAIEAGRLVVEPLDDDAIQPSSIDVRLDRRFRTFYTARHPYIDVKQPMDDLTELVEVKPDEAFILHPGEFVLGSTLERVGIPADLAARLEGKALALDTPVPTPIGWRTMGELRAGDQVFDERGLPCAVMAVTGAMVGRPCRQLVFSDGTTIVADEHHRWQTCVRAGRQHGGRRTGVVTTAQIARSLHAGDEYNHQIALAAPVQYRDRALPVDPYVLGVWLGDGTSKAAEITCADEPILGEIVRAGYAVERRAGPFHYRVGGTGHSRDTSTGRFIRNDSLSSVLRNLNLLGNKHAPLDYLLGSEMQRTALLQGLMDTDGYVDPWGRCEFTAILECLADAVVELAAGLGFRPVKSKGRATLNGVDCGPRYRVKFTPDRPVFRLPRKLSRQRLFGRHHRFRAIVDVREVESVPVRCIQVSAPSGLFLVGRTFIPTHNSSLGRLGLMTHSTAGFLDPGFHGHVTLELSNVANLPITLYPGMRIGQIAVFQLTTPAERPYGSRGSRSKYQGQRGPTPSRYWENFRAP